MIQLSTLIDGIPTIRLDGDLDRPVRDVAYDSRRVQPGDIFVAIPGHRQDGACYVAEAMARGAAAIVTERADGDETGKCARIVVPNARTALAQLSAARWGHPSRQLGVVGVTGTDGKTTTSALTSEIFDAAGLKTSLWSTVQIRTSTAVPNHSHRTTPEAPELQAHLAEAVATGCKWSVLEVSSHGLALDRVTGCDIDVAVLSNISPEHLDFHGTFAAYRAAKARLFQSIAPGHGPHGRRFGVVNADDPNASYFASECPVEVLTYGIDQPADVRARDIHLRIDSTSFVVDSPIGSHSITTRLVGRFNVYNWLAAITVALGQGINWEAIDRAAQRAQPVRGRAQRVDAGQPFTVLVDFAHTPQALTAVLNDCRHLTSGRVIVVLGHPGERYSENRPRLGAAAVHGADLAIVTSDDSYGEDPARIIDGIESGARAAGAIEGEDYLVVPDRRRAIRAALDLARPGDIVLIAGRGHLDVQEIGEQRIPFDDARVVHRLIEDRALAV